jgi:tail tube protein gp19
MAEIIGFEVIISSPTGEEHDITWKSWGGGGVQLEDCADPVADKFQTNAPGHKTVGEITLRGAMTDKRAALCTWINETVMGRPSKRTVTIKEILHDGSAGKAYTYFDCFPTRYVFPRLSVTNTTGNVQEEVRIKPVRCELK